MVLSLFSLKTFGQYQAGLDSLHPFIVKMNTDSSYYQNQSSGWFTFSTGTVTNVSGTLINLKPGSIIGNITSTVIINVMNLYNDQFQLVTSDTLHAGDTALAFTPTLTANKHYYIQAIVDKQCTKCAYTSPVTYKIRLGELPEPQCIPAFCQGYAFFFDPFATTGNPYVWPGIYYLSNGEYVQFQYEYQSVLCTIGQPYVSNISGIFPCNIEYVSSAPGNTATNPSTVNIGCNISMDPQCIEANLSAFTLTPMPFAYTGAYASHSDHFTICENTPLYLVYATNCGMHHPGELIHPRNCLGDSIAYGIFNLVTTSNTYTYYATATPYILNIPSGVTDFTLSLTNCIIQEGCTPLYGHVVPSPSVSVITTNTTNTICKGESTCFYYNSINPNYSYTTTVAGPSTNYTFTGAYTSTNPACTPSLTAEGVYTISTSVSFNYTNPPSQGVYYCKDVYTVTSTFTVVDCCSNTKPNNFIFENATFIPGPVTSFSPGIVNTGTFTMPSNFIFIGNFTFKGVININVPCTFNKSDIVFADGASLVINNNIAVNINQSYLHSCNIWKGIVLQDNTNLVVKHSVIEDAFAAIQSLGTLSPSVALHPQITIENTLLNKNIMGVLLVNANTLFSVKNSIFTSRSLNTVLYNIVLSALPPVIPSFNTIFSPALLSSRPVGLTHSASFAYPSYTGKRGQYGIYLVASNSQNIIYGYFPINIGVARTSLAAPNFENSTTNIFDYLNCGIYATNNAVLVGKPSEISVINNLFQNINNTVVSQNLTGSQGAIYQYQSKANIGNNIYGTIGDNSRYANNFNNCIYGVNAIAGSLGFSNITNNRFTGCSKAIYANVWNTTAANFVVSNNVANNNTDFFYGFNNTQINAAISTNTVMGGIHDVLIDELSNANNITYNINNNRFIGAYMGVYVNNAQGVHVDNNFINIQKTPPTLIPPLPNQAGVEFNNVINSDIVNNTIFCSPLGISVNIKVRGINLNSSSNNIVYCNNIQQVGVAMAVGGNCPTSIYSNAFCNATVPKAFYGILNPYVPFATVGDIQGPGSSASYHTANANMWGSTIGTQFVNDAISVNIIGGTVYYYPNIGSPDYPVISSLSKTLADASNNTQCSPPTAMPSGIIPAISTFLVNNNTFPTPGRRITNAQLYQILHKSSNISAVPGAYTFVSTNNTNNIGKFYTADSLRIQYVLSKNNIYMTNAQSVNASVVPADSVDLIQQQFNQIYHLFAQGDSLISTAEVSQLQQLAQLCPYLYGTAVYQARALLRHYDSTAYYNACEGIGSNNNNHRIAANKYSFEPHKIMVYPNPVQQKQVYVECDTDAEFEMYDLSGKSVLYYNIKAGKNTIEIGNIVPGTYLYKIVKDKALLYADKLFIQ